MNGAAPPSSADEPSVELLCWNVRCPSDERARRQVEWLTTQRADVFLLTECRESPASARLRDYFSEAGFQVFFAPHSGRDYCVLLASRLPVVATDLGHRVEFLTARVSAVRTTTVDPALEIVGVYVPSRGFDTAERAAKKQRFVRGLSRVLATPNGEPSRVFFGDLNVLEPGHVPRYRHFEEWEYAFYTGLATVGLVDAYRHLHADTLEYSWHGRTGLGYRYDHCFVSRDLVPAIRACGYVHEPRESRLSDHSAMFLRLSVRARTPVGAAV